VRSPKLKIGALITGNLSEDNAIMHSSQCTNDSLVENDTTKQHLSESTHQSQVASACLWA